MSTPRPHHAAVGDALPSDYDDDPGRFAANQLATRRFAARQDIHTDVASRFAEQGHRLVADIGGGNGTLARLLAPNDISTVVIDHAGYVIDAPRPAVRADAVCLPFADNTFDGAAALWMLYHLPDPVAALREARRILRPGGLLAVCAPSRYNDPELASLLPTWGRPLSFDAENGLTQLRDVFDDIEVQRWDTPVVHIPDRQGLALYLRGRGLTQHHASAGAGRLNTPLSITKRGMIAWARKTASYPRTEPPRYPHRVLPALWFPPTTASEFVNSETSGTNLSTGPPAVPEAVRCRNGITAITSP